MRILLVSSFLPYPLFSGGHIRLFNIIKQLSKRHKITLVCEKRDYQTENDIREIKKYCEKVITVDRRKQWTLKNIIRTGFSTYPFLITGHTNNKMKKEVDDLLNQEEFDLIHAETFYVMQNLPNTELPIVLVEHNIEYLVYTRFAKTAPFLIRPLLYFDILKLKYWEEMCWKKATKLVAVSDSDKRLMKRKDVEVIPNGVDLEKFRTMNQESRIKNKRGRILFIGEFKWVQNRNAIEWILKEIWPLLISDIKYQKSKIDVRLWIVGKKIPGSIKKLASDKSIMLDENASDKTELIYQKADVLLAPIRVGGGTSFKILEAMASGVPVITTSFGNEGIGAREDEEVLIASDAKEFAKKIIDILQDEKLYAKITVNARKLIEEKYDWEKIVLKLEKVYESAIYA